jgi:hypothetical protein
MLINEKRRKYLMWLMEPFGISAIHQPIPTFGVNQAYLVQFMSADTATVLVVSDTVVRAMEVVKGIYPGEEVKSIISAKADFTRIAIDPKLYVEWKNRGEWAR